jgi:hypothetical protein
VQDIISPCVDIKLQKSTSHNQILISISHLLNFCIHIPLQLLYSSLQINFIDAILNNFTRLQDFAPKYDIVILREAVYPLFNFSPPIN